MSGTFLPTGRVFGWGSSMLSFSDAQMDELRALERRQYVAEVEKAVKAAHPALGADETCGDRLRAAHAHAVALGFMDGAAITEFLHYEAHAPSFYKEPALDAWLRKPGQTVEQRWSDLVQVMRARTRER